MTFRRSDGAARTQRDFWSPVRDAESRPSFVSLRDGQVFVAAQRDEGSGGRRGSDKFRGPRGPLVLARFDADDASASPLRRGAGRHRVRPTASLYPQSDGFAVITSNRCARLDAALVARGTCHSRAVAPTPTALHLPDLYHALAAVPRGRGVERALSRMPPGLRAESSGAWWWSRSAANDLARARPFH